ncbi:MAG: hypothetical protein IIW31_05140 [Clostridia bacterium]|nr:hypothetical protein [Clostridia bacterium]
MKKILALVLTLCVALSMAVAFGSMANAKENEIDVTVGMRFEYNAAESVVKWMGDKGTSPDGLWAYKVQPLARPGVYMNVVINDGPYYAWANPSGDTGLGYARVRDLGTNFHPGTDADIVKVFYCPSGGTIKLDTIIRRATEFVVQEGSENTPTSLAIYVEDRKVFPEGGDEYMAITKAEDQTYSVTFDVKKNERVYIRIGAIGQQSGDAVVMSNTVTYEAVNDGVADPTDITLTTSRPTVEAPTTTSRPANTNRDPIGRPKNDGPNVGLIIGIVAAVVVVGGAAAFIFIKKKNSSAE